MNTKSLFLSGLSGLAVTALATQALAQDDSFVAEEIFVTAQKRSESLNDIPVAVSALGDRDLQRLAVNDVSDIGGLVPNAQAASALGITTVFLRGIGTSALGLGADPSVAYHADGIYVGRPRAQTAGFFDVQRMEIVRGPQGDLYGRNATGGSVNVVTRKPGDELEANLRLQYGNYDALRFDGGLSIPLIEDKLAGRVALYYNRRDGFGENIISGAEIDSLDELGVRLTLDFQPSERFNIELIGDYFRADDTLGGWRYLGQGRPDVPLTAVAGFGGIVAENPRNIASAADPTRDSDVYSLTATLTYDLSDAVTIKSLSGYREHDYRQFTDISGGSVLGATLTQFEAQDQFSQELQLLVDGDNWNLIVGGYYFTENISGNVRIPLFFFPGAVFFQDGTAQADAYAAFAHADYQLTDEITLIAGIRYSYERKQSVGTFTAPAVPVPTGGDENFDAVTPKFGIQYKPNDDLMVYASVARGFKSGGFVVGSTSPVTDPEFIWSYEVGLKTSLLDNRLQANFAAFYYDFSDLVVARVIGNNVVNENAAAATNLGFEAEFVFQPNANWRFDASFGYLDASYDDYMTADPVFLERGVQDLSGNRLNNAPEVTARFGAQYQRDIGEGTMTLNGDISYISETFFSPFQADNLRQGGYETVNLRGEYRLDSGLHVAAYARNLTNQFAVQNAIISADFLGFPILGGLNDPRTYGIEIGYEF